MSPILVAILILHTSLAENEQNSRGFLDFLFDSCNCRCGVPNREGKVVEGEFMGPHEYPWLVLVHVTGRKSFLGSLISSKYVLCTASALKSATPFDVKVTTGLYDRCHPDVSSTKYSTERLIIHPDYHPGKGIHNLALIKLGSPVIFERRISPICLPYPSSKYVGQVGATVSWPEPNEGSQNQFCRPRKLGLPILEEGQCGSYSHSSGVGCAGVVGGPSLVCKDDESSPVMYRSYKGIYELIGIFTNENQCNGNTGVSYYTMIGKHLSWIVQNTKDACYCHKT